MHCSSASTSTHTAIQIPLSALAQTASVQSNSNSPATIVELPPKIGLGELSW